MKSDLDRLMLDRKLDALIVAGGEEFNVARYYLSNGAQITHGTIFKLRGEPALLICSRMELEEAEKSGLNVKTDVELGYYDRYKDAEGDSLKATALHWADVMGGMGLSGGRVGLYGAWQINKTIALYRVLQSQLSRLRICRGGKGDAHRRGDADQGRR